MKTLVVCSALIAASAIGFLAGGNTVTYQAKHAADAKILAFDYEHCRAIIAKGSLDTNPGVPEDWKALVTTPGGNWCVR